jgi:hypothetical protein
LRAKIYVISGYFLIFIIIIGYYKMNNKKTMLAIAALVAAVGLSATTIATSNLAYAAITTRCTNPQGQESSGCNGGGSQQTETSVNPAGQAPPGQNK